MKIENQLELQLEFIFMKKIMGIIFKYLIVKLIMN